MHTFFPVEKGRYRYLIICLTCRFIVRKNSTSQYTTRMGQNTGTSKNGKKVAQNPKQKALHEEYLQLEIGSIA